MYLSCYQKINLDVVENILKNKSMENNPVISQIIESLGRNKVLLKDELRERITHVWRTEETLIAKAVIIPHTTDDVANVCRICNDHNQPIIIHGGLTNLVRSTETCESDIILSMERMNHILEIDEKTRTMTVEAGTILQHIQEEAEKKDLFFPLNFGAKGSCQIGGCIATNAGGLRVIKYGMTRNLVLGIEVVLADGTIINSLQKMVKSNTGYDLKSLIVGSEGTLGVVTRTVLQLQEKPISRNSAYAGFDDFEKVILFLKYVDRRLAGRLSAYEILWQDVYKALTSGHSPFTPPLPYDFNFYVLFESLGGNVINDSREFQSILEDAYGQGLIKEAVMAQTREDLNWFWNIREDIGLLLPLFKFNQSFDISLPITAVEKYVSHVKNQLKQKYQLDQCFAFGHLGDGNIHFVIGKDSDDRRLTAKINEVVYSPLKSINGSISAEHGIGLEKKSYLHLCRSPQEIEVMKRIKRTLDPKCILNPGKVFDI